MVTQQTVKTIDANGQIFLGTEFARQKVHIDAQEAGVWLICTTDCINECWIRDPDEQKDLEEAMHWAAKHGVTSDNTDEILHRLANETENA